MVYLPQMQMMRCISPYGRESISSNSACLLYLNDDLKIITNCMDQSETISMLFEIYHLLHYQRTSQIQWMLPDSDNL